MYTVHEVKMQNAPAQKILYYLTSKTKSQLRDHLN